MDDNAHMKDGRNPVEPAVNTQKGAGPSGMSRRDLLRRATAAMPVVMTLPSGAALAASSVYVGTTTSGGAQYAGGRLCLDTSSADEVLPNGTTYKYVTTTYADVYHIQDGDYYPSIGKSGTPIKADAFCQSGGTRYLYGKPEGVAVMPERVGALVSMTAINSVAVALDVLPLKNLP